MHKKIFFDNSLFYLQSFALFIHILNRLNIKTKDNVDQLSFFTTDSDLTMQGNHYLKL